MKVGWLADNPGYVGGAERTMAEFRAVAPCEVVDCPPGGVVWGLDRYVVGNCLSYRADVAFHGPFIRYHHDMTVAPMDGLLAKHEHCRHVFASPLQRERIGMEGECIPPALDLERLRDIRRAQELMGEERKGAVWLGMHPNHPGKGVELAIEWAKGNGGLDIYGNGSRRGLVPHEDVPRLLAGYKTFVHLPRAMEPFGRSVVEAWAAGCQLVVNKNVGAMHWIENEPEKLESASEDFWRLVASG